MFVCFFDVQSCQIFCDSVDCSLPGFSVLRIFQARILEWIALSYSMDYLTILYVNYTSIKLKFQRRQWHPTPVLLPGKPHGQRSLVGCSPWGREESDTTERLYFHFSLSCIGEGNSTPLQRSCLENSRDGGAWWASVYGVTQSWTRLKRLSSSSSKAEI